MLQHGAHGVMAPYTGCDVPSVKKRTAQCKCRLLNAVPSFHAEAVCSTKGRLLNAGPSAQCKSIRSTQRGATRSMQRAPPAQRAPSAPCREGDAEVVWLFFCFSVRTFRIQDCNGQGGTILRHCNERCVTSSEGLQKDQWEPIVSSNLP